MAAAASLTSDYPRVTSVARPESERICASLAWNTDAARGDEDLVTGQEDSWVRRCRIGRRWAAVLLAAEILAVVRVQHARASGPVGIASSETTDGADIYRKTCSVCHGERGDGRSFASSSLNPRPLNFTDAQLTASLTPQAMYDAIANGRPQTAMQPFKTQLTEAQIHAVIRYIRATFMHAETTEEESVLALGRRTYNRHCYQCHGYMGDGRTRAASVLSPRPRDFTDATAMHGIDDDRLARSIRLGRPGTAMQPFGRLLSDTEISAVISFLRASFVEGRIGNIQYHSAENRWPDFDIRYREAIAYFRAQQDDGTGFSTALERGRRIFDLACITCHQAAATTEEPTSINTGGHDPAAGGTQRRLFLN